MGQIRFVLYSPVVLKSAYICMYTWNEFNVYLKKELLRHSLCFYLTVALVTKVWSNWEEWSECSQTCGGGMRTRARTCSTGNETDCCEYTDAESCMLEYTQTRECINDDCFGRVKYFPIWWYSWNIWVCAKENKRKRTLLLTYL